MLAGVESGFLKWGISAIFVNDSDEVAAC